MPKLHRPGGPTRGELVEIEPTDDGLKVVGEELELPWKGLTPRIGGWEDAWIILETPDQPGLALWVEPDFVFEELAEHRDRFPDAFGERCDELAEDYRRRGIFRFLGHALTRSIRYGLLLVTMALIVGLIGGVVWFVWKSGVIEAFFEAL
ncbi:MAG: hypothetical protein GY898_22440 [Proteobacteria bacterium]|nr:hypothetical protein [Pseudomonadota bacterium]